MALQVAREDGITDLFYSSADTVVRQGGNFTFAGRFVHARLKDGKLLALSLVGAKEFQGFGWRLRPERDRWDGPVATVDYETSVITVPAPLPTDGSLSGQIILFNNPRYSRNTAYRILRVEAADGRTRIHLDGTLLLGKGVVDKVKDAQTLTSLIPHEYRPHRAHQDRQRLLPGQTHPHRRRCQCRNCQRPLWSADVSDRAKHSRFPQRRRLPIRGCSARRPVQHYRDCHAFANHPRSLRTPRPRQRRRRTAPGQDVLIQR